MQGDPGAAHPGYPQPGYPQPQPGFPQPGYQYAAVGYGAQPVAGYGQPGVGYGQPAMPAANAQPAIQPSYAAGAQQQPHPPVRVDDVSFQLPPDGKLAV